MEADAQNNVIVPAATQLTETLPELSTKLASSTDALSGMLETTNVFADGLDDFADTTVDGFEKIANRMDAATRRIALNEEQLRTIVGVGGGANGLPK